MFKLLNKSNKVMDTESHDDNNENDNDESNPQSRIEMTDSNFGGGVIKDEITDYVLVYNSDKKKDDEDEDEDPNHIGPRMKKSEAKANARKIFLSNLQTAGLHIRKVKHGKNFYILIHTPFEKLLEIAEKSKLKLPIETNNLKKESSRSACCTSLSSKFELPNEIGVDKSTKYFTAPYTATLHYKFERFFNQDIEKSLAAKDRCLLTYEVLCRTNYAREVEDVFKYDTTDMTEKEITRIGIERLLANGTFEAAYPLHEYYDKKLDLTVEDPANLSQRQILWSYWANPKRIFKYQPLHLIRDYFGEKLAFYFAWLGFYTTWLFMATFVGFIVLIYGASTVAFDRPTNDICNENGIGNLTMCPLCSADYCKPWKLHETCFYSKLTYLIDNPATIFFAAFVSIWSVFFIEFWQRKQSELRFEWDTEDFEKNIESIRPEFEVKTKKTKLNPVTDKLEPYVPLNEKLLKYFFSFSAAILMAALVVVFLFGVIVYRVILKTILYNVSEATRAFSGTIVSVTAATINLIIIIILGRFYSWLAVKLTNMENHRTDSDYEDSLTVKMYLFQFVNFYASVFYIAFFKGRNLSSKIGEYDLQEECEPSGCMTELTIQIVIILVGKQLLNNAQEIILPLALNKAKQFRQGTKEYKSFPQYAKDFDLSSWNTLSLFDEYLEMVIQFGFMTLFTVAFPLGPLFSLLNNLMEIRIDAFKILTLMKRPLPKRAQSIGIWLPIISAVSKVGVITNAFIIAFTSDFIPRFVYQFFYNGGSLRGYTEFTLSVRNLTETPEDLSTDICYYRDFREPYDSPKRYELTMEFYVILGARLAFVVVFEHVVFFVVSMAHYLIPDVSKEVQEQMEREQHITQKAIWEIDSRFLKDVRAESALEGGSAVDFRNISSDESNFPNNRRFLSPNDNENRQRRFSRRNTNLRIRKLTPPSIEEMAKKRNILKTFDDGDDDYDDDSDVKYHTNRNFKDDYDQEKF